MLDFIGIRDMEYFLLSNCSLTLSLSSLTKRLFRRTMSIVDPFSASSSVINSKGNFQLILCSLPLSIQIQQRIYLAEQF